MNTVKYDNTLPIRYDVDVLVAGGGPAGCAAAWAAAAQRAKVLLVESQAFLGGMGTAGLVPLFLGYSDGEHFLPGDFYRAVVDRMHSIGKSVYKNDNSEKMGGCIIHPESLKRAYEEIMAEAGVDFILMTQLVSVEARDGYIDYCVMAAKSGIYAVRAKVYIDCTGDGDLAAWAGVPYDKGDAGGGLMGSTLCSQWSGFDWERHVRPDDRALERAYEDGVFDALDRHLPGMFKVSDIQAIGNIGHSYGTDATDDLSLTKGLLRGRQLYTQYARYYNEYVPGFENAELLSTGALLGVRETRIIRGAYKLVLDDFKNRAVFDDEIGRFHYRVDIHASDTSIEGYKLYYDEYNLYKYKQGESYGIPYRVMLPQGCENLLVAGRCVSTDRHVQSSLRVMPGCMMLGQAAGISAAMCARENVPPKRADVSRIQNVLKDMNVYLPNC